MDAKGIKSYENMVDSIVAEKQRMGEVAAPFPKSSKEYLELPLEERMNVATNVLKAYAPNATGYDHYGPGKPAPAELTPSDMPGVRLEGEVVHKKYMAGGPPRKQQRHGGIEVYVTAVDVATGVTSGRNNVNAYTDGVGGRKRGPYTDANGETQTGWYAWSHYDGKEHPLTSQFGKGLVEFVDAAVAGLLDGDMLAQHRQFIGSQAVESAIESVV
jgi:hypothetical protein